MQAAIFLISMLLPNFAISAVCPRDIADQQAIAVLESGNQTILKVENGVISGIELEALVYDLVSLQQPIYGNRGEVTNAPEHLRSAIVLENICVQTAENEPVRIQFWINHSDEWGLLSNFIFDNVYFPKDSSIVIDQCGKFIASKLYGVTNIETCIHRQKFFDLDAEDLDTLSITGCAWISFFNISHLDLEKLRVSNCTGAYFEAPKANDVEFKELNFAEIEGNLGFELRYRPRDDETLRSPISFRLKESSVEDGTCHIETILTDFPKWKESDVSGELFWDPSERCLLDVSLGGRFSDIAVRGGRYSGLEIFAPSADEIDLAGLIFEGTEAHLTITANELRNLDLTRLAEHFDDQFTFEVKLPRERVRERLRLPESDLSNLFKRLSLNISPRSLPSLNSIVGDDEGRVLLLDKINQYFQDRNSKGITTKMRRRSHCATSFVRRYKFTRPLEEWCDPFSLND
ncbi:hypothetical protein J7399_05370 [Shimia sp. R9_1]|uniref:hypothetical protein n=1 Tax=Shimia sp. R9_1 TaxID=2821111 RepID=UPI001ADB2E01|nr:hypothetical protein [Shimia sp. R9_1]MBO9406846.1 hypothetical protein [Shimia sp. R9_1]